MLVKMRRQITGYRNGQEWPRPGETIELPDPEAELLIAAGHATNPTEDTDDAPPPDPPADPATGDGSDAPPPDPPADPATGDGSDAPPPTERPALNASAADWRSFAVGLGIEVSADMKRDGDAGIIAAVDAIAAE